MTLLSKVTEFLYRVDVGNPGGNGFPTVQPPSIDEVLGKIVNLTNAFLFTLGPVLLVAMIAYAGIQRMMAADNPQGIKQSNQILFYAFVGYVVVTVGFVIIGLAMGVVNFSNGIPTLFDLHF